MGLEKVKIKKLTCKQCLLQEGILVYNEIFLVNKQDTKNFTAPGVIEEVRINGAGICNFCEEYNSKFNPKILKKEINTFISLPTTSKKYDAIIAYSGGKNSTLALYLARKKYKLKILAYMLDNGFIPEEVKIRAKKICKELKVDLKIVNDTIYKDFFDHYKYDSNSNKWNTNNAKDLCLSCSSKISVHLHKLASSLKINKVIYGLNIYLKTEPYVSALKQRINPFDFKQELWVIALPFALQINYKQEKKLLKSIGWYDIKLEGYTSNCLIPGFTQSFCKQKHGVNFDLPYLAKELRCGYLTKEKVIELTNIESKTEDEENHQKITSYLNSKGITF